MEGLAAEDRVIAGQFGHCEHFIVVQAEGGKIVQEAAVTNSGHALLVHSKPKLLSQGTLSLQHT